MIGGTPWWGWLIALALMLPFAYASVRLGLSMHRWDRAQQR